LAPFGLEGGEVGARGRNVRVSAEGQKSEVPGAIAFTAEAGEGLIIETPGGGGMGGWKSSRSDSPVI
jgi:5-oxoprolinase (ATP-hydrolysing)